MKTPSSRCLAGALAALALQACDAVPSPSPDASSLATSRAALLDAPVILTPVAGVTLTTRLPLITGTVAAGAQVALSVDGRPTCLVTADVLGLWACVLPLSSALSDGSHVITATASVGTTTSAEARVQVSVLALGPSTVILTGPPTRTRADSATFTFASTALLAGYQCTLDDGAPVNCSPPHTVSGLAEGTHRMQVRSRDLLGLLVDTTPPVYTWTVDTLLPDAPVITSPAVNGAVSLLEHVSGTAEPGASVRVLVDGHHEGTAVVDAQGVWSLPLPLLSEGPHLLTAITVDAAGHVSLGATVSILLDLTPPRTSILSGPAPLVSTRNATFDFDASEPGSTFLCALNGLLLLPCADPLTLTVTRDGDHAMTVSARDAAGNVDLTPEVHHWRVDTEPPAAPVVLSPVAGGTLVASPERVTGTAEADVLVHVSLNGDLVGSVTADASGAWTLPLEGTLAHGMHELSAIAVDAAGNVGASVALAFTIDGRGADTHIVSGPPMYSASTEAEVAFRSERADVTFECRTAQTAFAPCANPVRLSELTDGLWVFEVRAVAPNGQRDETPAVHVWTVDTVAPEVTVAHAPALETYALDATFAFSANETPVTFECSVDGEPFAACESATTLTALSVGEHVLQVRARDAAGNTGDAVEYAWRIVVPGQNGDTDGGTSGGNGDAGTGQNGDTDAGTSQNGDTDAGTSQNGDTDAGTGQNGDTDAGTSSGNGDAGTGDADPGANPDPGTNPDPGANPNPGNGLGVLDFRGGGAGCSSTASSGATGGLLLLALAQLLTRRSTRSSRPSRQR
ncbi:Ig-like domain-containing protein [Corallococcus macrosporus]|uniref:OmpA domain-containing protein n=1 Tax=Myxococcus fulvus (strain ATCC BAA-855 / HW-1) TaxID=483219 RepID=F8CQ70_MYXFH|nr:Ig-like domain-containing protein [Corallococcus macrosporus]AEI64193.1 OmpA domain-containing protein [Corallococcus macrosporus]